MSKKRAKASQTAPLSGPISRKLSNELDRLQELLDEGRAGEALPDLAQLGYRHPREPEVFSLLFNAALSAHDDVLMLQAAERLAQLDPHDPILALNLAGAYMTNMYPALALTTFRRILERWPTHPKAADSRKAVADLEKALAPELARPEVPPERGFEIALLHERSQVALGQSRFEEARRLAESLLAEAPHFVPVRNNLSLAHFLEGRVPQAIAAARRVLEIEPDNFHALANLVHFLLLQGEPAEARAMMDRLLQVQSDRTDAWVKKAEALSFLGDDVGVQTVFHLAETAPKDVDVHPLLLHYAAAAEARLGDQVKARRLWERALKQSPGLALARENLSDLSKPVGERSGAWAIPFNNWLPQSFVRELARIVESTTRGRKHASVDRAAQQFMQTHPEMNTLVPILLVRGDPGGREFALMFARMARTPELLSALKEFIVGRAGTDQQRLQAAQELADAGVLARGQMTRIWLRGKLDETMLLSYEITTQPDPPLPGRLQRRYEKAMELLYSEKLDEAESLLQALADELPDSPMIHNNIATIYVTRGDLGRAQSMIRSIAERFPDYLFARCNLAIFAADQNNFEEAEQWLAPLRQREKFHLSEFRALAEAHINLEIKRRRTDSAKSWLEMWAAADPDAPRLPYWRSLLAGPRITAGLRNLAHRARRHR